MLDARDATKIPSLTSARTLNRSRHFNTRISQSFCHAPGVKKKTLRLLRTNSSEITFEENIENFRSHLRVRSYPDNLVNKVLAVVKITDRKSALQQKPQKVRNGLMPFVTQCTQYKPSILKKKNNEQVAFNRKSTTAERNI